ncbi:MAG: hypothetical protein M0Z84_08605 [Gammaproteobacteria bacterium]|nr:hypothetical protein [Gammaproteobacteria bacterium]
MAIRVKTRFRSKGPKTLADRASVVGVTIWRVAHEVGRHMEKEEFRISSDAQYTALLTEIIAFLLQITDRIVYGQLGEEDRATFMNALGLHLAKTMESNLADFLGPGDHIGPFISTLNARAADYAEFEFGEQGPGYGFLRYLGEKAAEVMAVTDNRWVIEHIMEIEAPGAIKTVKRVIGEVLGIRVPES